MRCALKINTDSVSKQLYDMLREEILSRRLEPGAKIATKDIAEANHVSIMPVRDALLQLASDGLVQNRERVGFFVRRFTTKEIQEIVEVRSMFELYCLRSHMENRDVSLWQRIKERLAVAQTIQELDQVDHELHRSIVYMSGNQTLIGEYNRLYTLFSLGMSSGETSPYDLARAEHGEIIDAILSNDTVEACAKLEHHLRRACAEIVGLYRN